METKIISLGFMFGLLIGVAFTLSYKLGYLKREQEFQNGSITFQVHGKDALWVDNTKSGMVLVKIFDPSLVEFLKDTGGQILLHEDMSRAVN